MEICMAFAFTEIEPNEGQCFGPDQNSWDAINNVPCLNHPGTDVFMLNMMEYRKQTRSTPYVVPSFDGKSVFFCQ